MQDNAESIATTRSEALHRWHTQLRGDGENV